jgi:hypothetical protein
MEFRSNTLSSIIHKGTIDTSVCHPPYWNDVSWSYQKNLYFLFPKIVAMEKWEHCGCLRPIEWRHIFHVSELKRTQSRTPIWRGDSGEREELWGGRLWNWCEFVEESGMSKGRMKGNNGGWGFWRRVMEGWGETDRRWCDLEREFVDLERVKWLCGRAWERMEI